MIDGVVARLRCPVCLDPVGRDGAVVRCRSGHSFDVARQGYLNLRVGQARRVAGDTAEMVAARARFLAGGWYAPLAEALVGWAAPVMAGSTAGSSGAAGSAAGSSAAGSSIAGSSIAGSSIAGSSIAGSSGEPLVVEVGAGTGYYLAAVLDSVPRCVGVALDVSKYALRRAARAGSRLGAVAVDVADRLPFADASVALLLDVFAPRNAAEMARVLRPEGRLLVVTPGRDHLAEVLGPLGAPVVDERKDDRLDATFADRFDRTIRQSLTYPMRLGSAEIADLVTMGPAGHHRDPAELRRTIAERWPDGAEVTASFVLSRYRPTG